VYDAVTAISRRHHQPGTHLHATADASTAAAAATAAHDTLVAYLPAQKAALDTAYAATMGAIPDGTSKSEGVRVGAAASTAVVALRDGDGRNAAVTYAPTPGPGVWRPTGPGFAAAQTPWIARLRPFVLASGSMFRPGPPAALTSRRYARDLNEIKAVGSATSVVRTPAQTEVARFWSTNSDVQYNAGFRRFAFDRRLDAEATARLLAMGDVVASDAAIACWDAKYAYGLWRPVTAIALADTDGNPRTSADPTWSPLLATPNHPEYVAAHGCLTAAEADVFAAVAGTRRIDVTLSSTVTGTSRTYRTARDLTREIVDARVWGGLHFRTSAERGVRLGHEVASYDLEHAFRSIG
jgi:hypothetical protein